MHIIMKIRGQYETTHQVRDTTDAAVLEQMRSLVAAEQPNYPTGILVEFQTKGCVTIALLDPEKLGQQLPLCKLDATESEMRQHQNLVLEMMDARYFVKVSVETPDVLLTPVALDSDQ